MTRNVKRAAAAVLVGSLGAAGCVGPSASCGGGNCGTHGGHAHAGRPGQTEGWNAYYNYVDPAWPERYTATARAETIAPFAAQVANGQVLEATLWNWHFESGTDVINPAGQAKLDAIAQVRPQPDSKIYLQVARDIPTYGAGGLDTVAARRDELTAKRAEAVRKYMAAQPTLHGVTYDLYVHDAPVPSMAAEFAARAYRGQANGYVGGIRTATGVGVTFVPGDG